MLNIKINDDFSIESDQRSIAVKYRILRKSRSGEGDNEYFGYAWFGDIVQALDYIIGKSIKMRDIASLEEIKQLILITKRDIMASIENGDVANFMKRRDEVCPPTKTSLVLTEPVEKTRIRKSTVRRGRTKGRR